MLEGGRFCTDGLLQESCDATVIDSTVPYGSNTLAQDGVAVAGCEPACADLIGQDDEFPCWVSPTMPFTLSQGDKGLRVAKNRSGRNDFDFVCLREAFLFYGAFISDVPRWMVSGEIVVGGKRSRLTVLVAEGPWNFGESFKVQEASSLVSEVRSADLAKIRGKLQEDLVFCRMEPSLKDEVSGLINDFTQSQEPLQIGQVRNSLVSLDERIHRQCWKICIGERPGFLRVQDGWENRVEGYLGDVMICRMLVVGFLGDSPILRMLGTGALVKIPRNDDCLRVVDLFAGIGGWSDVVEGLWGDVVSSVEIDEDKASALARTLNVPMVKEVREVTRENFVFCGDVFDLQWTQASWEAPFTVVLWSSPCVSWSQAGYAAGLASKEGRLLLRSLALLGILRPCASVGENVAALLRHQHFPVIQWFAKKVLGQKLTTKVLELQNWAAMSRRRVFLFDGVEKVTPLQPAILPLNRRHAVKAVIADELGLQDARIPDDVIPLLQDYDLLPATNRRKLKVGFRSQDVLVARVEQGILPVMMASYRKQHLLPKDLLVAKGLFTFLVKEVHDEVPRYLDCFEAARHMGFGLGLCLPPDGQIAAHAVGNAVAPVQACEVLNDVVAKWWPRIAFPDDQARKQIMTMLYGQADLSRFTRYKDDNSARLVPNVHIEWCVPEARVLFFWGDGAVWVPDHEVVIRHEHDLLPFGYAWPIETYAWVKEGLGRLVHLRFHKGLLVGEGFTLKVQPWNSVDDLAQVLSESEQDFRKQIGLRTDQKIALLTTQKSWKVQGVRMQVRDEEVMMIFEKDKRITSCIRDKSYFEIVDCLFPFGLSRFVTEIWDVHGASKVTPVDPVRSGIYQVFFAAVPFWIAPFGMVFCEPAQVVGKLQERLAIQCIGT